MRFLEFCILKEGYSKEIIIQFESNNVIMSSKEDNQGDGNEELYVLVLFHHLHYYCMFLFSLFG